MPPVPPEEITNLVRFVAEKSKNAKGPMNIRKLHRQFIEETGSSVTVFALEHRIRALRDRIPSMDEFDMETKVRMMIAVRAQVDDEFLRELRKEAVVEVNYQNRITRYEKRGGELKLEGTYKRINEFSSSSAKRESEPKTSTPAGQKRARTAREDSEVYDESMSDGERSSEGLDITEGNAEVPTRPTEINQNPANILVNGPNIENSGYRFDQQGSGATVNRWIEFSRDIKTERTETNLNHQLENIGQESMDYKPRLLTNDEVDGPPEEPSTSILHLLVLLRGAVMSIESPSLTILLSKIEGKIQKLSNGRDQKIPLKTIYLAFDPCLFLLTKHTSMKAQEESTSLRDFLCALRSATGHLVHPSMTQFHDRLRAHIGKLHFQELKIPINIVQSALDSVINFIYP